MNYYLLTNDSFWICLQNAGYRLSSSWLKEKKEKKKRVNHQEIHHFPKNFLFSFTSLNQYFPTVDL